MKTRSVAKSSAPYGVPKERSPIPSYVGGIALIVVCAAITFVGTSSAVDALNRNAANQMAMSQYTQPTNTVVPVNDVDDTADSFGPYDFTTDQLDWAHKYHITWDVNGNPIDENGNVMNDPTTLVNEVARAIANGTANADGISIDWLKASGEDVDEPSAENTEKAETVLQPVELYQGVDGVSKTADGSYIYTVKSGDSLNQIAAATGVPVDEIVKLNGITNPNLISVGQQLKLPSDGITDNASGAGLG